MRSPFARAVFLIGALAAIPLLAAGFAPVVARQIDTTTAASALIFPTAAPPPSAEVDTLPLMPTSRSSPYGTAALSPPVTIAPTTQRSDVGAPTTPSPSRAERRTFFSAILGREMYYYVYLPQGYDSDPSARYPVAYMLHGIGGNADEWLAYGAREAADSLMNSGAIRPFIIALPHGEQGYWVDQIGGLQWAAYVADDVVPAIDRQYRTLADRADRAIGGLSMGAHGALQIALNRADTFGIVGAHSPSFRPRAEVPAYFGDDDEFALRDPTQIVAARPEIARTLTIWLDYGLLDGFRTGQLAFEQALIANGIAHQRHEWDGDHSHLYWSAHLPAYLRFYDAAFTQTVFAAP